MGRAMISRVTRAFALVGVATLTACGFDAPVLLDRPDAPPPDAPLVFDAPPIDRRAGTMILAGQYHSCLLLDGRLTCWGQNDHGQLGVGDTRDRWTAVAVAPERTFTEACGGESHSCALETATGAVLCWGEGAAGQLADPSLARSLVPKLVPLPSAAIALACGYHHTCAVLETGALLCWGANEESQLGRGFNSPHDATPQPTAVGGNNWVRAGAGQAHSCAIRIDGSLWCWGRNESGECAQPPEPPGDQRMSPMRVGTGFDWVRVVPAQNATCGLRSDDSLWCWGGNEFGNLGFATPTQTDVPLRVVGPGSWSALADETFHGGAIQRDGRLWTWGRNVEGQLGLGDIVDRDQPTLVPGGERYLGVATGRFHTCVLRADKVVLCAGKNDTGALGTGNTDRRDVLSTTIR
jgi:alpha-tubulin suppressor-like RCC1 family protein